jgi:hypothetical protein
MATLVVGNLTLGLAAGLVGVAVPAVAIALGAATLAGVFSATGALGELCGGLVYGSRPWGLRLPSRLVASQCGSAVASGCLALASGSVLGMMLVMPVSGAMGAAQGVTTTTLVDDVAEPGALTGLRVAGERRAGGGMHPANCSQSIRGLNPGQGACPTRCICVPRPSRAEPARAGDPDEGSELGRNTPARTGDYTATCPQLRRRWDTCPFGASKEKEMRC